MTGDRMKKGSRGQGFKGSSEKQTDPEPLQKAD
jgi:hypothetical protein